MFFSAFYDSKKVYESGTLKLPEFDSDCSSMSVKYELFNKLDENFVIVFDQSGTELFVAKQCEYFDDKNYNELHGFFLKTFGEVLEIFNVPRLSNIFRLFACAPSSVDKIKDIKEDYSVKLIKKPNIFNSIDFEEITYLGEEMDGLVYFYDKAGNILVYADDDLMGHPGLDLIENQPEDTFYTDRSISTVGKLFELILIRR